MKKWLIAVVALTAACGGRGPEDPADLVLINGNVYNAG